MADRDRGRTAGRGRHADGPGVLLHGPAMGLADVPDGRVPAGGAAPVLRVRLLELGSRARRDPDLRARGHAYADVRAARQRAGPGPPDAPGAVLRHRPGPAPEVRRTLGGAMAGAVRQHGERPGPRGPARSHAD